jgi:hypothetical protein
VAENSLPNDLQNAGIDLTVLEKAKTKVVDAGGFVEDSTLNKFKKREEAKKLVAWIKAEYSKAQSARKLEENDWYINLAFYNGYQYYDWRSVNGKSVLAEEANPAGTPRIVVNRIEPIIRTEIAKTTSGQPSASVVPAANDDDDLLAATAAEQVWQSIYDRNNFQTEILQKAEFWRAITGNGFIKSFWDPSIPVRTPEVSVDPLTNEKVVSQKVSSMGDVDFEVVSPWHLFVPDLAQEDLEAQPYLFNVYTKSEQWVKKTFANVLPKDFVPSKVSASEIQQAALMDLRGSESARPDSVLVIEAWIKPNNCPYLPKGGLVTIVDSEIVQYSDNGIPYSHGEYPFAHLQGIQSGKFYRRSVIKNLIPLQREYNRTRSQIIQAKNLMARPQMMYAEGSVDPRKITARAGIWIPIRPGFNMPTPVPIQPLPSYVIQEVQQLQADFEDLSGQHQVSQGSSSPGVTAATAIAYLGERDDAYLTTIFNSIEAAIEKMARQALSLFVQYVTSERLIKTVGTDGSFDALMLTGADIASGTDIRVESGSALPTSKSARQALITEWMKMGFISPQDGLRVLEMGMLKQYYNLVKIDENQAQRENLLMKRLTDEQIEQHYKEWQMAAEQGDPSKFAPNPDPETGQPIPLDPPSVVPAHDYDNHAVHIEVHNRFRKSQSFDLLSDAVKAEFQKHIQSHQQALQSQMMMQTQGMMPPQEQPAVDQGAPTDQSGMTAEQLG